MLTLLLISFAKTAEKSLYAGMATYKTSPNLAKVQASVGEASKAWSPVHKGKQIVTPALRTSLVAALGHLAFNLAAADGGKELV
jgi:hypothetical protein